MSIYRGQRVLVTGGTGFLGSYLVDALVGEGARVRIACRRHLPTPYSNVEVLAGDLRNFASCAKAAQDMDYVFHLAAFGWGLGENAQHQPQLLTHNVLINTNMLEAAYQAGVDRYLFTSSSSVYPGHISLLEEDQAWDSPPHQSELCFGWAKRLGEIQARAYYEHYGMKIAIVRPTNPYGPRDNFDPVTSHVIPALIRKAVARENPFVVWGSGKAVRSFVHARDVSRGMLSVLENYTLGDPINLASKETTSIADLARIILELTDFADAPIRFDTSKPEGHPCKVPNVKKAQEMIGFRAVVPLRDGLQETIRWFRQSSKT